MTLFYIDVSDADFPTVVAENQAMPVVFKINPRQNPLPKGQSLKELLNPYLFDPTVEDDYTTLLGASTHDSDNIVAVKYDQSKDKWDAFIGCDPSEEGTEELLFLVIEQNIGTKSNVIKTQEVALNSLPVGTAELREELIATKYALSQRYAYGLAYRSEAVEALRKMDTVQRKLAAYERAEKSRPIIYALLILVGVVIGGVFMSGMAKADTLTSSVRQFLFVESDSNGCQYLLTREGGISARYDRHGAQICR